MRLEFYGLKTCDTCKKAQKALTAAGHDLTIRDVRADGVPAEALASWLADAGTEALVNKRSTTWRTLEDAARAKAETAEGAATLLLAHPTLMKRPVIVANDGSGGGAGSTLHIGWSKDVQAALL